MSDHAHVIHAERIAVLSGLDELARGLDYGQARTIREYIIAAEARVTELEAALRELAGYVTAHLAGADADPELRWALAEARALLAKEDTDE